ncbi:hypothetical protein Q31b_58650 [Novipirellula aureliae]|uniref:Uncharacterized protein n=1 Tax=Novipirellula aureliae TaxID=2527966 RepID=A0A5C6D4J7_9BACT|nr:hypothetical protein Q31b_58650 [Novipirellula aureliae]
MALPNRNRRNTHIDGNHFHWVKGSRGDNGRGVVTVQLAAGSGAKLMIDPHGQIRDDEVRDAIRFALTRGWEPNNSCPPMWIGFSDQLDPNSRFVLRSASNPPYWKDAGRTSDGGSSPHQESGEPNDATERRSRAF